MRTLHLACACVLLTTLTGCHANGNDTASVTAEKNTVPVSVSSASAAPDAADARSPIPAFHGGGEGWRIDLKADRGMRHTARLFRDGRWLNATLMLRSATPTDDPTAFAFEGTVFAPAGDTPMQLEIDRADCSGRSLSRPDAVRLRVRGNVPLQGCGQITPY